MYIIRVNIDNGQAELIEIKEAIKKIQGYYNLTDEQIINDLQAGLQFKTCGYIYKKLEV